MLEPVVTPAAFALTLALAQASQGNPWDAIWAEMEALRGGSLSQQESALALERLRSAGAQATEPHRALLLSAALDKIEGRAPSLWPMGSGVITQPHFGPTELWFWADLMRPGPERAAAIIGALAGTGDLARWKAVLAWNVGVDEARALRLENALPIQLALHERFRDGASASDLALTYRALGQGEEADRVLRTVLLPEVEAGRAPADLWESRGINALGFGDEPLARDYLGKALACGSRGAALLLSRLELMAGRSPAARSGFRAMIHDQPPPDWAWRGWGSALLPAPYAPSSTRPSSLPSN